MTKKRASIRDVAKAAGVSHATVSLILNGKMAGTTETRERVLDAVRDLGYRPDANFRKAVSERARVNSGSPEKRVKTSILALLLPEAMYKATQRNDGYYSGVFSGACQAAAEAGWSILLCPQVGEPKAIPEVILDERVDGVLAEGGGLLPAEWLATIAAQLPFAAINFLHPELECIAVTPNWEKAGFQLVEYAIAAGHSNLVFFQHDTISTNLLHINRGHEAALAAHGLQLVHPELSRPYPLRRDNTDVVVRAFVDEWAQAIPRPTIIITTDYYAGCIASALEEKGFSIPGDVSLLGRDGSHIKAAAPVSTYVYPVHEIGHAATKLLIQSIETGHYLPTHMMLPGEMVDAGTVRVL